MGVPHFKPPPRINYQTRSERISASSLALLEIGCPLSPRLLPRIPSSSIHRGQSKEMVELFRSMGHSSMSIPRSQWNDRKFMGGERTRMDEEGNGLRIYDSSKGSRTIYIAI